MKLPYAELSQTAQIEAFRQVMALNPIETRTATISDLMETYEFNYHGMIIVPEQVQTAKPASEDNRQFRAHGYSENF